MAFHDPYNAMIGLGGLGMTPGMGLGMMSMMPGMSVRVCLFGPCISANGGFFGWPKFAEGRDGLYIADELFALVSVSHMFASSC